MNTKARNPGIWGCRGKEDYGQQELYNRRIYFNKNKMHLKSLRENEAQKGMKLNK